MKLKIFIIIYTLILSVEGLANAYHYLPVQFFSKPALMGSLIVYFYINSRNRASNKSFILGALIFSWFGDLILLCDKVFHRGFIFGLIVFLIAHLFYIIFMVSIRKRNIPDQNFKITPIIGVLAYTFVFYLLLFPYLRSMRIPVIVYTGVITVMLISVFQAFDLKVQSFGRLCVLGAILFAASDSIIAINRFIWPFSLASLFIILTYAIGQFLITEGVLRNLAVLKDK